MTLGIRGSNPIWAEFDLSGKIFDDTFWMYVLENTIPYAPKTVYHDPDLNVPWDNPIQFLGNGTLPNDVYFVPGEVYRLEFRQSDGLSAPTQQDPLIYLVENYMAGEGGSTPIDTIALLSENQITNPQFALFDLANPSSITASNPDPIKIGPGWFLDLAGTGTVTISQVPLTSTTPTPSNAPYALRLQLSGWTADSVVLRQRFEQSGVLWANKIVSTVITARVEGAFNTISTALYDSQNTPIATLLNETLDNNFEEYPAHDQLLASTDTDTPPSAYIEYRMALPSNVDIYITSVQIVVQDLPVEPAFQQDSINRQIDHSYNAAYPIVPVGTVIDFVGFGDPTHYFFCDGTARDRVRYYKLFNAMTRVETVTTTNGLGTFTVVDGTLYGIGTKIEGTGLNAPTGATITNIVGNVVTFTPVSTHTGPTAVRFYITDNGNGVDTFNLPDLRGYVIAGAGTPNGFALFTSYGPGAFGGESTHVQTINEMPSHHHSGLLTTTGASTSGPGIYAALAAPAINTGDTGGGVAMSLIQPTTLLRKCIRYE